MQILPNEFYLLSCVISMQKRSKIYLTESCQTKVALILQNSNKLRVNVPNSKNTRIDLYCRSSYAGN